MEKVCPKCDVLFDKNEFTKNRAYCKNCWNEYNKIWQKNNPEKFKQSRKNYVKYGKKGLQNPYKRKKLTERKECTNIKAIINYLLLNPCVDCGEDDILCLSFDHVDSKNKSYTISSQLKYKNIDELFEEISKCQVRCSNCHSRRTAFQRNHLRVSILKEMGYDIKCNAKLDLFYKK